MCLWCHCGAGATHVQKFAIRVPLENDLARLETRKHVNFDHKFQFSVRRAADHWLVAATCQNIRDHTEVIATWLMYSSINKLP